MAWLDSLASDYPSLCRVEDVGTSYEGRTLKLIVIGTGAADNPGIFIDGGMFRVSLMANWRQQETTDLMKCLD